MTRLLAGKFFAEGLGLDFYIGCCVISGCRAGKGLEGAEDANQS